MKILLGRIWQFLLKTWKDPVLSKVISAGIIGLLIYIWAKIEKYTLSEVLLYNVPLFAIILSVIFYVITSTLVKISKEKAIDPIWKESIGHYTFQSLFDNLNAKFLPEATTLNGKIHYTPTDNLTIVFYNFSTSLYNGVYESSPRPNTLLIFKVIAPILLGYGLVNKTKLQIENDIYFEDTYKLSEAGIKFKASLDSLFIKKPDILEQLKQRKRDS